MTQLFQAVMFDLDGTLADTLADIAAGGNHALAALGRPTFPVERYRYLAGQGAPWLIEQALGPDHQHLAAQGLTLLKSYQMKHGLDHTTLYPGIAELLDVLTQRGIRLALLSNKPDPATQEANRRLLGRWKFDAVEGHRADGPLKPDPAGALAIARRLNIPPDRWLYLGDTRVDMLTACAAGMYAVGVLWGFREEAELRESGARKIISHPLQLLDLLDG